MRYSILGFNQERVMSLKVVELCKDKNGKDKEAVLSLDLTDLLILNLLADFPNRTKVKKVMKGDEIFFWASYDMILKELPILDIKKHALALRFEKMEKLQVLERDFLTINGKNNLTFFRLTNVYESLLYGDSPSCNQMQDPLAINCDTLLQSNATPSSNQLQDNNNIINNNITRETIDTNVSYEVESKLSTPKEDFNWGEFANYFNQQMANKAIKPISQFTPKRKSAVKARMREYGKKALADVILKAAASDFLNGKNNRGWTADFDWLFKPNNFPKVLEGNYNNRVQYEQRIDDVQRRQNEAAAIIARLAAEENDDAQ